MTAGLLARERRLTARSNPPDFRSGAHRYRDPRFDTAAVRVFPGDHYVTGADEMLVTVLGACVSACIRDPVAAVGGMNHFMLPQASATESAGNDGISSGERYGTVAMERLINDILACGGLRHRLEIKIFGAANVLRGTPDAGDRNAVFVENYLAVASLPIDTADLRGTLARRIHYFPATGRVMLLPLRRAEDVVVVENETRYQSKLQARARSGA